MVSMAFSSLRRSKSVEWTTYLPSLQLVSGSQRQFIFSLFTYSCKIPLTLNNHLYGSFSSHSVNQTFIPEVRRLWYLYIFRAKVAACVHLLLYGSKATKRYKADHQVHTYSSWSPLCKISFTSTCWCGSSLPVPRWNSRSPSISHTLYVIGTLTVS